MKKQICFNLNGTNLYLDSVFVYFNEIPIFFTCIDTNENRYLVLCTNVDDLKYYIVTTSTKTIYDMLNKKISMREAILNSQQYWDVSTGMDIENDLVVCKDISNIDKSVLPLSDAVYENDGTIAQDYLEKIADEYYNSMIFDHEITDIKNIETDKSLNCISPIYNEPLEITEYLDLGIAVSKSKPFFLTHFNNLNEKYTGSLYTCFQNSNMISNNEPSIEYECEINNIAA